MGPANKPAFADVIWALTSRYDVGPTRQSQCMYWMAGPWCTEYRGSGLQPAMTYAGSTQSTLPENMGMPLLCSMGNRQDHPRQMVLMNAAQVEEQVQQLIPRGIWPLSLKRRHLIQQRQEAAIH